MNMLTRFILLAYLLFWVLLSFTGFMISRDIPEFMQTVLKNLCAWSPTFAVLIMFRKLYPGFTFKEYMNLHFGRKIKPEAFLISLLLQVGILVLVVLAYFMIKGKSLNTISFIGVSTLIPVILVDLSSGAVGEELGWRGYMLNLLQRKYVPLKASLIVGVAWGLWHLPLLVLSGYEGLELLAYFVAFMVAIISVSVVITFFYNKSKNILIAMWIHFWFNFLLKVVIIDNLSLIIYLSVGYLALAILLVVWKRKAFNNMLNEE